MVNIPSIPSSGYNGDWGWLSSGIWSQGEDTSVARICGSIGGSDCCVSSGCILGVAQSSTTDGAIEVPIVIASEGARVSIDACV